MDMTMVLIRIIKTKSAVKYFCFEKSICIFLSDTPNKPTFRSIIQDTIVINSNEPKFICVCESILYALLLFTLYS